jgi:hypothetical protein
MATAAEIDFKASMLHETGTEATWPMVTVIPLAAVWYLDSACSSALFAK